MITLNFNPNANKEDIPQILKDIRADKMGGWMELPLNFDADEVLKIKEAARTIEEESDYLVCIGIGGSYLGHRAIIEALSPSSSTKIVYAGNSLSKRELTRVMDEVGDADFTINVISKSGTTLEPAIAFKAFKEKLIEKYGEEEANKRIFATTDAENGTLHDEAVEKGYTRFVVPDNIGGRYSVLSAVGLLPLAVAGVDIDKLLEGASDICATTIKAIESEDLNQIGDLPAIKYAIIRHMLRQKNYDTEVFATFEPATAYFNEWLKQLFGESEGKEKQGIWPTSVVYSTDLHSLGQFMQDGRRNLWETIIDYPTDETNAKAVEAVRKAHSDGGIPVLKVSISSYDEKGFGELIYFFELSCAISAKLQGVNPFDQPGVEAYKAELHKLLDE